MKGITVELGKLFFAVLKLCGTIAFLYFAIKGMFNL